MVISIFKNFQSLGNYPFVTDFLLNCSVTRQYNMSHTDTLKSVGSFKIFLAQCVVAKNNLYSVVDGYSFL